MVKAGDLDLGLGMFLRPTAGVKRTPLFRLPLMLVRPGRTKPRPRRWADLLDQRFVGLPADNPLQQLIARQLSRAGYRSAPHATVNYLDTQIALVAAGAGIAVVPSSAMPACRMRRVTVEPLIAPVIAIDLYEIHHPGRRLPPAAAAFCTFLREYMESRSRAGP